MVLHFLTAGDWTYLNFTSPGKPAHHWPGHWFDTVDEIQWLLVLAGIALMTVSFRKRKAGGLSTVYRYPAPLFNLSPP